MSYDVECPVCLGRYLETTEGFDPKEICRGSQLRMKDKWVELGWQLPFSQLPEIIFTHLLCPGCGAVIADGSGKVRAYEEARPTEFNQRYAWHHVLVRTVQFLARRPNANRAQIWEGVKPDPAIYKSRGEFFRRMEKTIPNFLEMCRILEETGMRVETGE